MSLCDRPLAGGGCIVEAGPGPGVVVGADVSIAADIVEVAVLLLRKEVVVPPTQTNPAEPMPIPVVKERQSPTFPPDGAGEREGFSQNSRSEMKRTGWPFAQKGRETTEIPAVWFASRQASTDSGIDSPFGFVQSES